MKEAFQIAGIVFGFLFALFFVLCMVTFAIIKVKEAGKELVDYYLLKKKELISEMEAEMEKMQKGFRN